MILAALGPVTAWRMHTPCWAVAPTSGAGAQTHGGRANRPGTPALYLALEARTALAEYQQLSPLMPPGTLVTYTVAADPVVDFRGGYVAARWSSRWRHFHCDWRRWWFGRRFEPPSWQLADEVIAAGAKGIVFGSALAPGGTSLVLYTTLLDASDVLQPYDPAGALPRNQDSWR